MNNDSEYIYLQVEGGDRHELRPNNSKLFTFWGHVALENGDTVDISTRNHVYFVEGETAQYIFDPETVQGLGALMLKRHYPADLYRRNVPQCDEEAYQLYLKQNETADDLGDFVPEEWT